MSTPMNVAREGHDGRARSFASENGVHDAHAPVVARSNAESYSAARRVVDGLFVTFIGAMMVAWLLSHLEGC